SRPSNKSAHEFSRFTFHVSRTMNPPTFPARPINGGPLTTALPKSGEWFYEPKYNGWRALVHVATGAMFNRKLEPLTIAGEFKDALHQLCSTLDADAFKWADCESLERRHGLGRGTLIILDVVPEPAFASANYRERRRWLQIHSPKCPNSRRGQSSAAARCVHPGGAHGVTRPTRQVAGRCCCAVPTTAWHSSAETIGDSAPGRPGARAAPGRGLRRAGQQKVRSDAPI